MDQHVDAILTDMEAKYPESNNNNSNGTTVNSPFALQTLQGLLETLIETLRQTVIVIEESQSESQGQSVLNGKINKIVEQLQLLNTAKDLVDISFPVELLDFIDSGKNPDNFTKAIFDNCTKRSEATKGKIQSLKNLRSMLQAELEKEVPDFFPPTK